MKSISLPRSLLLALLLWPLLTHSAGSQPDDHQPQQTFRRIEQPLAAKIGVTVGGLSLIGLELWWFLLSRSQHK